MKGCELCGYAARMHCESDDASLCWDCDEKVHGANFLVAKHTRTLLCHVCQSPTPWQSSGPKLTPTVSVCENCVHRHNTKCQPQEDNNNNSQDEDIDDDTEFDDDDDDDDTDDDYYDSDVDDDDDDEEEEGENQVVPWSCCAPPPVASSSSSEGDVSCQSFVGDGGNGVTLKRMRENSDLDSDDEIGCSGALVNEETTSMGSFRPLKQPRTNEHRVEHEQAESRSTAIINSLKRLQKEMITGGQHASSTIIGICNLSRDVRR